MQVMAFDHIRLVAPPHNERFFLHLSKPGLPSVNGGMAKRMILFRITRKNF